MITLTPEQARARLESNENLSVIIEEHRGVGGGNGSRERKRTITDEEKKLMATVAIQDKVNGITFTETAKEFGVHRNQLNDYMRGAYSDTNSSNPNNERSIRKPELFEAVVSEKAIDRLTSALDKLSDEKLDVCDANSLSSVAVKMATVHEKITGNHNDKGAKVIVNIYSPRLVKEEHFNIVEI